MPRLGSWIYDINKMTSTNMDTDFKGRTDGKTDTYYKLHVLALIKYCETLSL